MPSNIFDNLPPRSQSDIVRYMATQQRIQELNASNAALKRQYVQLTVNKLQADAMAPSPEESGDECEGDWDEVGGMKGKAKASREGMEMGRRGLEVEVDDEDEEDSEDEGVASGIYRARPPIKPSFAMGMAYEKVTNKHNPNITRTEHTAISARSATSSTNRAAPPPIKWSQVRLVANASAPSEPQSYHSLESIVNMAEKLRATKSDVQRLSDPSSRSAPRAAPHATDGDSRMEAQQALTLAIVPPLSGPSARANASPISETARHVPLGPDGRYQVDFSRLGSPSTFNVGTSPPPDPTTSPHPRTHPSTAPQTFSSSGPKRLACLERDAGIAWSFQRPGCLVYHLFKIGDRTTPDHFPRHTQMMDKLLDPRLSEANRTFGMYADDNFSAGQVVGLHRLPPAAEVQRRMLWSFVRVPEVPNLPTRPKEGLARKVYRLTRKEKLHAEEAMCHLSAKLENMNTLLRNISQKQLKRFRAGKDAIQPPQFVDTRLGQEMIETYMQLEHGHIVMQLVCLCAEIDVITSEQMRDDGVPKQCGPQFHFILLDRVKRMEWMGLEVAIEVARAIWHLGQEVNLEKQNPALTASIFLRAIAYLLPYFPSRWLMEPWEARVNGLVAIYVGILTQLGSCLSVMKEMSQSLYRVYAVLEHISGINGQEHLSNVGLLIQSLAQVPRHRHRDILRGTEQFKDIQSYYADRLSEVSRGQDTYYKPYNNWHIDGILSHKLRWYPGDLSDILVGNKARRPFWQLDSTATERAVAAKWNTWAAQNDAEVEQWFKDMAGYCNFEDGEDETPKRSELAPAHLGQNLRTLSKMPNKQAETHNVMTMQVELEGTQAAPMERTGRGSKGYDRQDLQQQQRQQEARQGQEVMVAEQVKGMMRDIQENGGEQGVFAGGSAIGQMNGPVAKSGTESQVEAALACIRGPQPASKPTHFSTSARTRSRGRMPQQGQNESKSITTRFSSQSDALFESESSADEVESATIAQRYELGERRSRRTALTSGRDPTSEASLGVTTEPRADLGSTLDDEHSAGAEHEHGPIGVQMERQKIIGKEESGEEGVVEIVLEVSRVGSE